MDLLLKIAVDCLKLNKMDFYFELISNFEVHKLDISKLKKYQVKLDYYKNQVQRDTAKVTYNKSLESHRCLHPH